MQFEVVLPPLASLVWAVQRGGVKGGALLDLLYAKSHSGVPPLQACMQRSVCPRFCPAVTCGSCISYFSSSGFHKSDFDWLQGNSFSRFDFSNLKDLSMPQVD